MTTTLRPESPETPVAGGGRTRRWQIRANGRPVGALRTTATPVGGEHWGAISELEVWEGRGRGRATIGALAAEEVLRGWDCTRVDVDIPEGAHAARQLAATLGYTERMRNMAKQLTAPPDLPGGVGARPIDAEEFPAWLGEARASHRRQLRTSGLSEAQARARSEAAAPGTLAQGADTPGVVLRRLYAADDSNAPGAAGGAAQAPTALGSLWVELRRVELPDGHPLAWVMGVEVDESRRGHGHGRTLMLLAERECLAAGVHHLGLNVFSGNDPAIRLYTSLGYRVTNRIFGKTLI
ncbi:GNAT family N-acetyltransferase [Kitasatospora sp. NPDC050543]|uniref:GNAT family N-acetyltransferase n=1 Tax=Kitasatospora sp. NPDC050543 TaxID=3364054 RepID=UPI0037A20585